MVAFKNFLGGIMYVDESRVDEYLSNGYERIAEEVAHIKSEEETEETEQPKRTVRRKRK